VVDEFSFRNSPPGIEDFASRMEPFKGEVSAVVESTANLWIQLYDSLEDSGILAKRHLLDKVISLLEGQRH
jgi:hypothetical protein